MTFYCQETAWTECLGDVGVNNHCLPWDSLKRHNCSLFGYNSFKCGRGTTGIINTMVEVFDLLHLYTERALTYDDDALSACLGIFRYVQQKSNLAAVQNLSGLPFMCSATDEQLQRACIFATMVWSPVNEEIIPKRRKLFPSWTWAGWKCNVNWKLLKGPDLYSRIESAMRSITLSSDDEAFAPPFHQNSQCELDSVKAIEFEAPIIPRARISCENWAVSDRRPDQMYGPNFRMLHLPSIRGIDHLLEQLDLGTWSCFLLGFENFNHLSRGHLLVVEWQDEQTAVRVGLLRTDVMRDNVDLETLEWRTVKLI